MIATHYAAASRAASLPLEGATLAAAADADVYA